MKLSLLLRNVLGTLLEINAVICTLHKFLWCSVYAVYTVPFDD